MRRNLIILIAVALSLAVLVAVLVRQKVAPSANQTQIMVAKADLTAGTTLSAGDVKWQVVDKSEAPPAAIIRGREYKEIEDIAGRRLRAGIYKGLPVLLSALTSEGETYLAGALDKGMRAISIPVSAQSAVGGFIQPGNLVDVILTYDISLPGSSNGMNPAALIVSKSASETVVSKVRVLAVDQEIKDIGKDAKPARTVTIAVSPEQAEKVALAQNMGDLSISLRSLASDTDPERTGFTSDVQVGRALRAAVRANSQAQAEGGGFPMPMAPAPEPMPAPQTTAMPDTPMMPAANDSTVTIYNGGQVSKLRVQGGLR